IRDFHVTGVQTCALPICRLGLVPIGPVLDKDHSGLRAGADQFRKVGIDFSVAFQLVTDARGLCPHPAVAVDEMNGAPLGHVPLAGPCSLAGPAAPGSVSDE